MSDLLLLATHDGLAICRRQGDDWHVDRTTLHGHEVTSVIAREGVILAATRKGVQRSDDLGLTWREPFAAEGESPYVRWLAYHPDISDREFAGAEPAGIYVSHDGAQSWRACPEVAALRETHAWFLPYSDGAGCVRGFAFNGTRAYAAVEVGGLLRSDDGGETWRLAAGSDGVPELSDEPAAGFIYPDVHDLAVHPSSPDLVYAATGGGFYRSRDGGATWRCLYDCYVRALWVDPRDPEHVILGAAEPVDRRGRIEETRDGGETWQPAGAVPGVPWSRHMVERLSQAGDTPQGGAGELLAVLSNGSLLAAPLDTLAWRRQLPAVRGIAAATTMVDRV